MTDIQQFAHAQTGAVLRTVHIDGAQWFLLTDLAKALGYRDAEKALRALRDSQYNTLPRGTWADLGGRGSAPIIVTEGGLYRLLMRSTRPEAASFQEWVEDEVLPTLRKTGVYVDPNTTRDPAHIRAEVEAQLQRMLQKKQYKEVVRDALKAIGAEPGWQYGEIHNVILVAITGHKASAILASGRPIQTFKGKTPTKADRQIATNYLDPVELELFNLITDAAAVDLRIHRPTDYGAFLDLVRTTAARCTA